MKKMPAAPERIESIDQFRGLAIILMIIVNFMAGAQSIPSFLKHAPDIGYTLADLVAPLFIFSIAFSLRQSLAHRIKTDSKASLIAHHVTRNLSLIGIGAIISAGEQLFAPSASPYIWGVLQAIGAAGLILTPFLFLKWYWRLVIGIMFISLYQILLDGFLLTTVLASAHGGLFGSVSWAALLILSTVFSDLAPGSLKRRWLFPVIGLVTLAAGILLSLIIPVSKNRVSISYIIVSLGASALIYSLFYLGADRLKLNILPLKHFGRNPLVLYLLHYVLLAFFVLPDTGWWYTSAPLAFTLAQCVFLLGSLALVAFLLAKKNIRLSL